MFGALKLKLYAAIGGLMAILMGVVYAMGRKDNAAKEDREDAKEYRETDKRISDVDLGGDDTEWLRERKSKRDL